MGLVGASRKTPNDAPWETWSQTLIRPIFAPLLTAVLSLSGKKWLRLDLSYLGRLPLPAYRSSTNLVEQQIQIFVVIGRHSLAAGENNPSHQLSAVGALELDTHFQWFLCGNHSWKPHLISMVVQLTVTQKNKVNTYILTTGVILTSNTCTISLRLQNHSAWVPQGPPINDTYQIDG